MVTKDEGLLKLSSMAPLDDGGRKYNIIYVIAVVAGVIIGIFLHNGIEGIVGVNLLTLLSALTIKHCILDLKWKRLRQQKFFLENKVPYELLIHYLIEKLSPLNFQVEKGSDGNPVLTHKKMIYDINYGDDDSFTIWWRKSIVGALFDFRTSIYHYRNTVADMGIIGYAVQQICCENAFGNGQQNAPDNIQENITPNGANAVSTDNPKMNQNPYVEYMPINVQDKRKHTGVFVGIAIAVLVIFAGVCWLASLSDEEVLDSEDNEEEQYESGSGEEDINNGTEDVQDELAYGLNEAVSFELNNGGQISVTFTKYGQIEDIAYINYEIENIGNTSVTVGESLFSVYANDYAAELNFGENTIYQETISVGRKVSGTLYPNMLLDKVKRLEIECGDVIFLLRDTSAVDAMLGTYYRQYEEDGNIVVDEIKLYREVYNNDGLAISANHHIDFGNEYDYDYDFGSWTFELYGDRIEFINKLHSIEGLTVYYSQNPREEGIDVVQSENSEVEDMFTGHYEWTDNIEVVYEAIDNVEQPEQTSMSNEDYYDSEVQGDVAGLIDVRYIDTVWASSELTDSSNTYKVDALLDGNKDTCWAEGVDGNGEGEYIEIYFTEPVCIKEIYFLNGYMKNEDVFNKNGKIKRVELTFSDGYSFEQVLGEHSYSEGEKQLFSDSTYFDDPICTEYLKVTILEAEAGEKYADICLSELEMWGYPQSAIE